MDEGLFVFSDSTERCIRPFDVDPETSSWPGPLG